MSCWQEIRCYKRLQVKQLFQKLEVDAKIVELDQVVEGDEVQVSAIVRGSVLMIAAHIIVCPRCRRKNTAADFVIVSADL